LHRKTKVIELSVLLPQFFLVNLLWFGNDNHVKLKVVQYSLPKVEY